jgi:serine/threonine protein kinase
LLPAIPKTSLLRENEIDFTLIEEVLVFAVGEDGGEATEDGPKQYCVAIERPNLTLTGVVNGMLGNEECQSNSEVRKRYTGKVFSVLRLVAKALRHLHSLGIVHGNVCMESCGKYEDKWKLGDILGIQKIDTVFEASRFAESAPPEGIEPLSNAAMKHQATFRTNAKTHPSIDVWGFGKMAFEVLTGEALVEFETGEGVVHDHRALMDIMHWSDFNLEEVRHHLKRAGVSKLGMDVVVHCLSPDPKARPTMEEILQHPVWKELRRQIAGSGRERNR